MVRRFLFGRGRRRLLSALAGVAFLAGCGGGEIGEPTGNLDTIATPDPLHSDPNGPDRGDGDDMPESKPPIATPSGYLLLSAERLAELKAMVSSSDPAWLAFKDYVDGRLDELNIYNDSPENRALMYLLTGEQLYADAAWDFASELMSVENVRFDSYLHFGDLMRHAAIVLSYCDEALSSSQRDALIAYLDSWTNELWFNNQGSGWGLADPGNNYHLAFLEGTAYSGYALQAAGVANGQVYVDLLLDKLEKDGGVLDYLDHVNGGGWFEGTNYGERSKQRLNGALSVVASMGGTNHFYEHPYLGASVRYAVYELQPDGVSLYPGGDLARDSRMPVTPSERDYLLSARFWLGQGVAPSLATWYVDNIATTFDQPAYRHLMFKNMV
ncbi:MAG TPA: hypothetical protein VFB62_09820, partial [Polyangiaceae bacterium]|nr:hypothetical protein [Polyangiaceae bacterium]